MSSNEAMLKKKIDSELKKFNILKSVFLEYYDQGMNSYKKRLQGYEAISKIDEIDNPLLSDIYKHFNVRMRELEDVRKKELDKLLYKYLPITEYYPNKLKGYRKNMNSLADLRRQREKADREKEKAMSKSESERVKTLAMDIATKNEMERSQKGTLESGIVQLEKDRAEDNKYLLLHFVHSELEYHAACLEKMTNLFNTINNIEPREILPQFMQKYRINMDLRQIGIDMSEINRNKSERERAKEKQINLVFNNNQNEEEAHSKKTEI